MDDLKSRPVEYYRQFAIMMAGAASIGERRRLWEEVSARQGGVPAVTRRRDEIGGVPVEWIANPWTDAEAPILVFLHGGGFALGSVATHFPMIAHLAEVTGCRVLGVDYRLFPEHPFPAQIEDAVAVYRGLLALGFDAGRIALVGDSAGGGLVVSSLLLAKQLGTPMPAAAVCIGPWVDLAVSGLSMATNAAVDPIIKGDSMRAGAQNFLAGVSPYHPLASPIYADLGGLPPLLIQVGTTEALLDDSRRLAGRAQYCGVDAVLREWPDMVHGWHQFADYLPQALDALAEIRDFLNAQPGWTP